MFKRTRYIWDEKEQKLVELSTYRVEADAPTVYSDTIDKTYCHADGKYYESRSAMKRGIKESGCDTMEWGTQIKKEEKSDYKEILNDMERSRNDLRYGNAPLTEYDKHVCKEMNERYRRK